MIDNQNQDRRISQQQRQPIAASSQAFQQQIQSLVDLFHKNTQAHAEFRTNIQRTWDQLAG